MAASAAGRFAGRVAVVTGGSRGIGEGIVRTFAREGGSVVFNGLPAHAPLARALIDSLPPRAPGQRLVYVEHPPGVDARSDPTAVAGALVAAALGGFGRLDAVVNNAAYRGGMKPTLELPDDDFVATLGVNLVFPWALIKAALPSLRASRGSVVNISSLSGTFGHHDSPGYCASKGGLVALTKALAIDEARHGVRVNAVSPGNVWTPLWAEHVHGDAGEIDAGRRAQVLGRYGTPGEVGEVVLHLAAEATFTTGIEYIVSGGAEIGYGAKAHAATAPPAEAGKQH